MIDPRYEDTYTLMAPYTCTPHAGYTANLLLAETIKDTPGDIVECGVWRGGMIAGIAHLLGGTRHYHLFDSFQGLPEIEDIDGAFAHDWINQGDHFRVAQNFAVAAMELAGTPTYTIHAGWFKDTLPTAEFPDGIAFLRLDADWYTPMHQCLDALFPHVNPGGIISIDDYYFLEGAAKALHHYLAEHQRPETIHVITDAQPWTQPIDGVAYLQK